MSEVGRNDPCPCGSGKKYKKCCGMNKGSLRSFSKETAEGTHSKLKNITNIISQSIREKSPEAADRLDKEVKKQMDILEEEIEKMPEEGEGEEKKNNEDSSS